MEITGEKLKAALLKERYAISKAVVSNCSKLLGAASPEELSEMCDTIKLACEIVLSSNGKTTL